MFVCGLGISLVGDWDRGVVLIGFLVLCCCVVCVDFVWYRVD